MVRGTWYSHAGWVSLFNSSVLYLEFYVLTDISHFQISFITKKSGIIVLHLRYPFVLLLNYSEHDYGKQECL